MLHFKRLTTFISPLCWRTAANENSWLFYLGVEWEHTHTTARTWASAHIHVNVHIKACASWESQQSVSALLFTPIKAEAWITRITTAARCSALGAGKEDEKNSHHAATQGCSHQRTLAGSTLSKDAARFELNLVRRRKSFHMPFFTRELYRHEHWTRTCAFELWRLCSPEAIDNFNELVILR